MPLTINKEKIIQSIINGIAYNCCTNFAVFGDFVLNSGKRQKMNVFKGLIIDRTKPMKTVKLP